MKIYSLESVHLQNYRSIGHVFVSTRSHVKANSFEPVLHSPPPPLVLLYKRMLFSPCRENTLKGEYNR